jgi:AAA domain
MSAQPVSLPGPVAVVPSGRAAEKMAREQYWTGGADRIETVIAEIGQLARAGTLPARLEDDPERLVVYTQRHMVALYVTKYGDAYRLGHLAPLSFRDHERLSRGALLLHCPAGWHAYHQVNDLPRGLSASWDVISRAWAHADFSVSAPQTMPSHHADYLDLLTEVVEATRDIEIERQRAAPPIHYRHRGSTREERHSARGVYEFQLLRPAQLAVGAPVYITDEPDLRGKVIAIADREAVVRFDTAIDYRKIPSQGALQMLPSDRVYRAQLEAIDALRHHQAASGDLLASLVDWRLCPYTPDTQARPREHLDSGQLIAFQRALAVPDRLAVLGPPGTGKTRTITEIAAACAALGQQVLVTSQTNRAVDNVLERLPAHIRAVRVGNEDAMTSHARGFMVETQVEQLREEILAATEGTASRLAPFTGDDRPIVRWQQFLTSQLEEAARADAARQAHEMALDAMAGRISPPLAARLTVDAANVQQARARLTATYIELRTALDRLDMARSRSSSGGLVGLIYRWMARSRHRKAAGLEQRLPQLQAALTQAESSYSAARDRADEVVARDPEGARLVASRATAISARQRALAEAGRGADMVRAGLRAVVPLPDGTPGDLPEWAEYARMLGGAVALAARRAELLDLWRDKVRETGEDLHHEVVHYADVVAATCIGTATTRLLADLTFDLAIVDEAGQIATPNLLVPLIRAKRSVLVGDHHQLPPFLDDEVKGWVEDLGRSSEVPPAKAQEIADLLRRSAFERFYSSTDEAHRVMLTVQRRMPEPIARFVSREFYSGALHTEHGGIPGDPVFQQPFAMADTADRSPGERSERHGRRKEEWGRQGYCNEFEASLIADLITEYVRWYPDWAVIVPYRAQAERVTDLLGKSLGDHASVADSVGTVDAFQGGERDLIVYGFTRSNDRGEIGFLKELRRLNVAITRARRQLVLVGDSETLLHARDKQFAELMNSMIGYLRGYGDIRASGEVASRLIRLREERP